jgi:acetolactate synthase I/II/III large subunit
MRVTGGQLIADHLIREGVKWLFTIPGHGNTALLDAFVDRKADINVVPAMHEQGAAHMAAGYYRASGELSVVCTSIGPGATNTITALTTAFVDSVPLLLLTGGVHTYLENRGLFQEIDRPHGNAFPRVAEPVVKRWWQPARLDLLPRVLDQAFIAMREGRPGPVLIDIAQDLQADEIELELPAEPLVKIRTRTRGDRDGIIEAAELLVSAQRPLILAGGGVISAEASSELVDLAEWTGAPVIHSFMGKGAMAADHQLYAGGCGEIGTLAGNELARSADVLIAIGCRFSDRVSSSWKPGVTFSIPSTKLIHIDIDGTEIGRNYPTTLGIVGDAKAVLGELVETVKATRAAKPDYAQTDYFRELVSFRDRWANRLRPMQESDRRPTTISRLLATARRALPRDTIIVTDSGYAADQAFGELPVYGPRTNIMPGGMCEMGFGVPTAIGVKLARPDVPVAAIVGDGSLLQTGCELAVAAMLQLPIVVIAPNNGGWGSVKDLQLLAHGRDRDLATNFQTSAGTRYFADLVGFARSLGCSGERVEDPGALQSVLERAAHTREPILIEVPVADTLPWTEMQSTGWWDVPVPANLTESREKYVAKRGF